MILAEVKMRVGSTERGRDEVIAIEEGEQPFSLLNETI